MMVVDGIWELSVYFVYCSAVWWMRHEFGGYAD